nr:M15 family metallopeptidase [Paenibacillus sp. IHBB 10380]
MLKLKKWIMLLIVFMLAGCEPTEEPHPTGSAGNEGLGQGSGVHPAKQKKDDNQTNQKPDAEVQTVLVEEDQVRRGNLVLVNKEFKLDAGAIPSDIVNLNDTPELLQGYVLLDNSIRLSRQVAEQFNGMMEAAAEDGVVHFMLSSGYRDMEEQAQLYREKGADYALPAGYSEHNLGLSMDIGSTQMPIDQSPEGKWLQEHAWKHGFILRYPKDKTEITGIQYEPWHFRYVGLPHSLIMEEKRFTLEEYLMFLKKEKAYSTTVEGQQYDIRYVSVANGGTVIELPQNSQYELSGSNMDGVIVTVKRSGGDR